MKKLYTLLLTTLLFSAVIFAQNNLSGSYINKKDGNNTSKIVKAEIKGPGNFSGKISPLLNMVLNSISHDAGEAGKLPGSTSSLQRLAFFYKNDVNEIIIPVFIKTNSVELLKSRIIESGGRIGTIAGNILTAQLTSSAITELAGLSEVIYIDASSISEAKIDVSRTEAKVDLLHNGTGISRPYKGNGVIVGVVDSGIDWKHLDFKNSGGSRIQYLWDMSGSSNPPSGYSYGTEYTKAQIDANQCQEIDGDDGGGHGTHVSGTAAGNGGALPNYMGMAPESEILFVKGFRSGAGFANSDVVDGCNYIFQKAQQLGKPAVINLSLGGHYSSHDGTSLYDQALSNLTGNGKIIVAAAGNEGGNPIHLSYAVVGSSYNDANETYFELANNASFVASDMWYNGGSISVGIAAYDANLQLIGYTQGVAPGQNMENVPFTVNNVTYGYININATGVNNPNNGANEVVISIDDHNGQVNINNCFWSLYTYGTGTFDAWALGQGRFSTYSPQTWIKPGDDLKTIGTPGTAAKLICIGSYVTKNQWVDVTGTVQYQPGNPVIGSISSFSSKGPTRDGRLKPDICAPGEVIVAAYSSFLTQTPQTNIIQGGKHQKMEGTSMATPHVTGSVALLLEKNRALNYDQVVTILKNTTKKDNFTGNDPNNIYGYGKLDAYNAFNNTPGGGGTQTTIIQEGFDAAFPPSGWSKQVTNTAHTWIQSNPQNNNFNQIDPTSQYSALCPYVAENQNEWIISPAFNLGSGSAHIEFYAGYSTQWLSGATLKLHISTNGGTNWTEIWTADNDGQPWMWRSKNVDLTAYANKQNLKLGWQYIGNDGDLIALDGVKLLGYVTGVEDDNETVMNYVLNQNYPNPFNPETNISFSIPDEVNVNISVFNALGERVAQLINEIVRPGQYIIKFNGSGLASGLYLYTIKAGTYLQTRKMLLLK